MPIAALQARHDRKKGFSRCIDVKMLENIARCARLPTPHAKCTQLDR